MLEEINAVRPPNPILTFKAAPGPTIARWVERKRQTMHVADLFQDLARHPWVGERQAGTAANLYTMTARQVDAELRALPYAQRLDMPQSGAYPIVTGAELGPGPNPWDLGSNQRYAQQRKLVGSMAGGPVGGPVPTTRARAPEGPAGPDAPRMPAMSIPRNDDPMDFVQTTNLPTGPGPGPGPATPAAPRSFVDRLKNVGGHLLNSTGEVGASAAAGGAAYLASGGNPTATALAVKTGSGVYRYFAPRTGRRVGARASYTGQLMRGRQLLRGVAGSVRRTTERTPPRGPRRAIGGAPPRRAIMGR